MVKNTETAYAIATTSETVKDTLNGVPISNAEASGNVDGKEKVGIYNELIDPFEKKIESIYARADGIVDNLIGKKLYTNLNEKIKYMMTCRENLKTAIQALGTGMPDNEIFYNYYKWLAADDSREDVVKEGDPVPSNSHVTVTMNHLIKTESYIEIGCCSGTGSHMQEPQGTGRYPINENLMKYIKGYFNNGFCLHPQSWNNASEMANEYTTKIEDVEIINKGAINYSVQAPAYMPLGSSTTKGYLQILVDYDYVYNGNTAHVTNQAFSSSDFIYNWTDCANTNYSSPADITHSNKKTTFKFSPICRNGSITGNAWTSMTIKKIYFYFYTSSTEKVLLQELDLDDHTIVRGSYQLTNPYIRIFCTEEIDTDFLDDRAWVTTSASGSNIVTPYLNFLNYYSNNFFPSGVAANNAVWASRTKTSGNFTTNALRFAWQKIKYNSDDDVFTITKIIKTYKTGGLTGNDVIPLADYTNGVWIYMASSPYGLQPSSNPILMCKAPYPDNNTDTGYYVELTFIYNFNTRGEGGGGGYIPEVEDLQKDSPIPSKPVTAAPGGTVNGSAYTPNEGRCVGNPFTPSEIDSIVSQVGTISSAQETIIRFALGKVCNCTYSNEHRDGPDSYDCSSLAYWACKAANIDIRWYDDTENPSHDWGKYYTAASEACGMSANHRAFTDKSQLQPGDLVFHSMNGYNNRYKNISHITIYIGNGMVVDMSKPKNNNTACYRSVTANSGYVMCGRPWG